MAARIQSSAIEIKIDRLFEEDAHEVSSFSCGNEVLDNFFHEELFPCVRNHHLSAYCARSLDDELLAIFTLANDSIILNDYDEKDDFISVASFRIDESYLQIFNEQSMFPAVNIGHLGVAKGHQNKGVGTQILEFVIDTYRCYTASGCQFVTVDALNTPEVKRFYSKRFFERQTMSDESCQTVRMYFTLDLFR